MSDTDTGPDTAAPFAAMASYHAIPRVTSLVLSPDGSRLVIAVSELSEDGTKRTSALWDVDPSGQADARRLTWGTKGESAPTFRHDGSLLFASTREGDEGDPATLWLLPAGGGEARRVLRRAGGIEGALAARDADVTVVGAPTMSPDDTGRSDEERRTARKDAKVGAILHQHSPVRFWDHDLGPDEPHYGALSTMPAPGTDGDADLRDLTPDAGRSLFEASGALTADGSTLVTSWHVEDEAGHLRGQIVLIDVATGNRRVIADDASCSYGAPDISPDGSRVLCLREVEGSYDTPPRMSLWLIDVTSGQGRALLDREGRWPDSVVFAPDGRRAYFTADELGHHPVFSLDLDTGAATRLTESGHVTTVRVAPDGTALYALHDYVDHPPAPVRIDLDGDRAAVVDLPAPGKVSIPGRLEALQTTVADGTDVHSRLALPEGAGPDSPAPLLLWIHGGPLSSWNAWSWRWNPWLMVAAGYAVLLPDPALSTGYGEVMIDRGWGEWGGAPYTDLMSVTDEVLTRPDVDETRIAAMGGSYGGYMANWVAGHTDRFAAIVTHASLWAMDQFHGTTDMPAYWVREWGLPSDQPERYETWSPHKFAGRISTPMLVVHCDKDYRVPVGEGLRLWFDLKRLGVTSEFLYYPDEGHWVLAPNNSTIWYETVLSFLARHVLGEKRDGSALL